MVDPRSPRWRSRALAGLVVVSTACSEDVWLGGETGDTSAGTPSSTSAGPAGTEGTGATTSTIGDPDTGSTTDVADEDDGPKFDSQVPDSSGPTSDCLEEANYIYVLADEDPPMNGTQGQMSLFRFRVETLTFEQAAPIAQDCHLEGAIAYTQSFGVDRNARAYMSGSGAMLTVDLHAAVPTCEYLSDPSPPFGYASLSYAGVDPEDASSEVLFMHDVDLGFGSLDPEADPPHFTQIAPVTPGSLTPMPLAGTSDGRLYAIRQGQTMEGDPTGTDALVQLDPATGVQIATHGEIEATGPYPPYIAFYGGDIFVFDSNYAADPLAISPTVRRFDLDDDDGDGEHQLDVLMEMGEQPAPFFVRGAASPTCLPLTPEG